MNKIELIKLTSESIIILTSGYLWINYIKNKLKTLKGQCLETDRAIVGYMYCIISPIVAIGICFGSTAIVNIIEYLITKKIT